jgi:hypothetical protein
VEERLERERRAGRALEDLGRGRRARQIARKDARNAFTREASGQSLGLRDAAGGQRTVGELDDARGVANRLAVADEEDHRESVS